MARWDDVFSLHGVGLSERVGEISEEYIVKGKKEGCGSQSIL